MSKTYAIITGASEGIGLEFAKVLAGQKYNLILVARREELLKKIAEHISSLNNIDCKYIALDLSKTDSADVLFDFIDRNNISANFLVNNAGMLQNGFFSDLSWNKQYEMITLNISTLSKLAYLFIHYLKREHRPGYLLNVASLAGWIPIPNQNVYAATKAYVVAFSLALANEINASGQKLVVSTLCPGFTDTKMMNNPEQGGVLRISESLMLSAEQVAKLGIRGCLNGKRIIMPGFMNKLTSALTHLFSKSFLSRNVGAFYRKNMT